MPVNSFENYPMTWRPTLQKKCKVPCYMEIAQALEKSVRDGSLRPGDKLPPQRELADFLDVNLSTIARAFKLCAAKGLICGEIGRGTYIASDVLANLPMLDERGLEHCINMGASHPLYAQNKCVGQMLIKLSRKTNIAGILEYAETSGHLAHRQSGKAWLEHFGLSVTPQNILITSGLQNSLAIILSSLFRFGDKLVTNAVIYPGIKNIANMLGIQLLPVPYRERRMDIGFLSQLCHSETIRGIYLIPDYHNPTAVTMSPEERAELAVLIREHALLCIEDGTYSFLCSENLAPITSLIPEQSIYISTVSNAISAGLRVAFLTMPPAYMEQLVNGNSNVNVMASPLDAELASKLIDSGIAGQITEEKREAMRQRNRLVEAALGKYSVLGDQYAQFRWLELPTKWSGQDFECAAKEAGVQVFSGERFAVGSAAVSPAVRLAISSPRTLSELEAGLRILKQIL